MSDPAAGPSVSSVPEPAQARTLEELERGAVTTRRTAAGFPDEVPGAERRPWGLALSGGGIRSATFSLGVLQALAKARLLRQFDYLSTVSGGGYIGSFLGRLYQRDLQELSAALPPGCASKAAPASSKADLVETILTKPESRPLEFLRENGRYLSPNGAGDAALAASIAFRNLLSVHIVLGSLFVSVFLALLLVRVGLRSALALALDEGNWIPLSSVFSDWLLVPAVLFLLWVVPTGWAYWLAQPKKAFEGSSASLGGQIVLGVTVLLLLLNLLGPVKLPIGSVVLLGGIAVLALLALIQADLGKRAAKAKFPPQPSPDKHDVDRERNNLLSRRLTTALIVTLLALAVALLNTVASAAYAYVATADFPPPALKSAVSISGLIAFIAWARRLLSGLAGAKKSLAGKIPMTFLAAAVAAVLATLLLVLSDFLALGFASNWTDRPAAVEAPSWWSFGSILLATAVLAIVFGQTRSFLNNSSLQTLYGARLSRAYLGASNPARWTEGALNVTDPMSGDGLEWTDYQPHASGGPLHLVNVTLNETISGKSHLEQFDRKGLAMAIGPKGLSVGRTHEARWSDVQPRDSSRSLLSLEEGKYRVFESGTPKGALDAEALPLETWVSISGAAFTTGLGSRTCFGYSFLCGLFNVRIGYWWNSGVNPKKRTAFEPTRAAKLKLLVDRFLPVQAHLLDEWLARFRGPNSRLWYLSDGGHFENTACYELIRRRLPLIVVCDNGADPEYQFGDLAGLVRKARIDFGADIRFLDAAAFAALKLPVLAELFGPLENLERRAPGNLSIRAGALAEITYAEHTKGLLVVLKPALTAKDPLDLIEYHTDHPPFPQEQTADQFFDEAQWESYRKLGETIGTSLVEAFPAVLDGGDQLGAAVGQCLSPTNGGSHS